MKGYRAWNALGRFVRRGEKGIGILCPCIRKIEEFAEPDDKNEYNDKEGEKQVKRVIAGFKVGYVYDINVKRLLMLSSILNFLSFCDFIG